MADTPLPPLAGSVTIYAKTTVLRFPDSSMAQLYTVKKRLAIFPSPAGMSLTKLSLARNNLIFSDQGEFGKRHPGWGRENG